MTVKALAAELSPPALALRVRPDFMAQCRVKFQPLESMARVWPNAVALPLLMVIGANFVMDLLNLALDPRVRAS